LRLTDRCAGFAVVSIRRRVLNLCGRNARMSGDAHASQRFHPVTASVGVSRARVANPQGRFSGELLQDSALSAGEDVQDPAADSMRVSAIRGACLTFRTMVRLCDRVARGRRRAPAQEFNSRPAIPGAYRFRYLSKGRKLRAHPSESFIRQFRLRTVYRPGSVEWTDMRSPKTYPWKRQHRCQTIRLWLNFGDFLLPGGNATIFPYRPR